MTTERTPFTIIRDAPTYPAKDTELIFGSDYAHSEYVIPMARFKFFDATGADSDAPSIYIRLGGTFNTQLSNGYQESSGIFGTVTPGQKVGVDSLKEFSDLLGKVKGSALEAIQKGLANALGAGAGYISSAGQSGKPQIEFLTRKLFNSFQQLIYQGPRFRSFQLPFNMKPTSYEEAKIMRDIIHTFRVASSPRSHLGDTLAEDKEDALIASGKSLADIEAFTASLEGLSDTEKRIKLTEEGLDAFNNDIGQQIQDESNAPLTFGYPDMVQLEFILYKKGTGDLTIGEDKYADTITMLFQSEYCMIENVGLDYGAQNKMVFLSSPESAEAGDYFPSEVNMTIALKESVLITAAYASAEHATSGRTIF